jgi:hypothetical protein
MMIESRFKSQPRRRRHALDIRADMTDWGCWQKHAPRDADAEQAREPNEGTSSLAQRLSKLLNELATTRLSLEGLSLA